MYNYYLNFRLIVILFALSFLAVACPYSLPVPSQMTIANSSIIWHTPVKNTDGSLLTDLQGYKIYYKLALNNTQTYIVNDIHVTSLKLNKFLVDSGTYHLSISAYDKYGLESDKSNEIIFNIK